MSGRARRASATLLASLLALLGAGSAGIAVAATPRASFNQVQGALMCVLCNEPLNVARSPEAYAENAYVRSLIQKGETRRQILNDMVQQYGTSVLAKPPATGFNVLIYVVPPVVVALGLITLALTIPRWRRRGREAAAKPQPTAAALSDEDSQRLDADLARGA